MKKYEETMNQLYYGDNLEIMRKYVADESVDLCYIDPPFNSKRNYNQIYNNIGNEDKAQSQAFVDTWKWGLPAEQGLDEIISNKSGLMTKQSVDLILMLERVLGKGSMLSYLVSMTNRIAEIYRVLKPTGSFYLHCDPTMSHYLKLVLDGLFCSRYGEFQNEIVWKRYAVHSLSTKRFDAINDTIFFYSKSRIPGFFNRQFETLSENELKKRFPHIEKETNRRYQHAALEKNANKSSKSQVRIIQGREVTTELGWVWTQDTFDKRLAENPYLIYWTKEGRPRYKIYEDEYKGKPIGSNWIDIPYLSAGDAERLGYPTQKPEALLERIILASSNEGDVVFDAYCGCGTTIAVAERLNRNWIGIDITYQSVSLILKRLEDTFGKSYQDLVNNNRFENERIKVLGVPLDIDAAIELANRKDDRLRKEFEKWAVLTYTNNRAIINEKKGGDGGIDGIAYIREIDDNENTLTKTVLFSVKSNKNLNPSVVRDLYGTIEREKAICGVLLTLYPMENLEKEASRYGKYRHKLLGIEIPCIQVVTIQEMLNGGRLKLPVASDVLKSAERKNMEKQEMLFLNNGI